MGLLCVYIVAILTEGWGQARGGDICLHKDLNLHLIFQELQYDFLKCKIVILKMFNPPTPPKYYLKPAVIIHNSVDSHF